MFHRINARRRIVAAVAIPLAAATFAVATPEVGSAAVAPYGGNGRAATGVYISGRNWTALRTLESKIGRKFNVLRAYERIDGGFGSWETNAKAEGRTVLVSINSEVARGRAVRWKDIANAKPGSSLYNNMVSWAQKVKSYGRTIYFGFNHEPEEISKYSRTNHGSAAEFKAAWQKWVTIFRSQGVTNVRWTWIMSAYSFVNGVAPAWYPGDAFVDEVAADGYNWARCWSGAGPWREFSAIFGPALAFAKAHGKLLNIPETGSAEGSAGKKGQWIDNMRATLGSPAWKGYVSVVTWFNRVDPAGRNGCRWPIETSTSSVAAFKRLSFSSVVAPAP